MVLNFVDSYSSDEEETCIAAIKKKTPHYNYKYGNIKWKDDSKIVMFA